MEVKFLIWNNYLINKYSMSFNAFVNYILDEMAMVKTSDLSNWPYEHGEGGGDQVRSRYRRDKPVEEIQELIKKAVLEISKDPNVTEIDSKDLAEKLKEIMLGAKFGGTSAGAIAGKAVNDLLTFLKGQPTSSKKTVVNTVVNAVKDIEDKPAQAVQIATQAAQDTAEVVAQAQPAVTPEPEKKAEETPGENIEMPSGEVLTKNEKLEIFNSTVTLTVGYYENFLETVNKFNLKSAKRDIPPIEVQFIKTSQKQTRNERLINLVDFKVIIPPLILGGVSGKYKFIAKIDHTQNNVISIIPGSANEQDVINKYAEAKGKCERVGCADRKRNATFIVQDTSNGKLIQLGSVCLEKYIGGAERDIISLLNSLENFTKEILGLIERTYKEDEGGGEGGGGGGGFVDINKASYNINDVLAFALMLVKSEGFKSKAQAGDDSTAERIKSALSGEANSIVYRERGSPRAAKAAKLVEKLITFSQEKDSYAQTVDDLVQWGLQEFSKPSPNPEAAGLYHNVKALLGLTKDQNGGFLKGYSIGKVVWIVPKFLQSIGEGSKQEKPVDTLGEFVGSVGHVIGSLSSNDKVKMRKILGKEFDLNQFPYNGPIVVTLVSKRPTTKNVYGRFGDVVGEEDVIINYFKDDKGNNYAFRTSAPLPRSMYVVNSSEEEDEFGMEVGEKYVINRAIIKYQNEHESGKKTNYLSNAKIDKAPATTANESISFAQYYSLTS
jgi:hypothetical protein